MSKIRKMSVVIVILGVLIASCIIFYIYNMPHRNIQNEKPIEITAKELASTYSSDETSANQQFLDKTIQVKGVVANVESNADGNIVVVLQGDAPLHTIRCTFAKKIEVKPGDSLVLTGRCTGFLTDVILIDCWLDDK